MNDSELWDKVIERWENIACNRTHYYYIEDCPFCLKYNNSAPSNYKIACKNCPIYSVTKQKVCYGTKYYAFLEHTNRCKECGHKSFCDDALDLAYEFLIELRQLRKKWETENE